MPRHGFLILVLIAATCGSVHSQKKSAGSEPAKAFDVAGIFGRLAGEDYDRAVDLARGLQSGAPRANAVIAIARSVLDETKK